MLLCNLNIANKQGKKLPCFISSIENDNDNCLVHYNEHYYIISRSDIDHLWKTLKIVLLNELP